MMHPPQNILVPIDFSKTAHHALAYAQTVATALGASVHVLHVVPDPRREAWSIESMGMNLGRLLEAWQQRLDALPVDAPGERLLKIGEPCAEITRCAESQGIDLIVMGTHGRGATTHMRPGSVAGKVVRKARCPVLTVPEPGEE